MSLGNVRRWSLVVAVVLAAIEGGCGSSSVSAPAAGRGAVFVVDVVGERFRVLVRDSATLAQARRILTGAESQKIVTGELASGSGGFNSGWSWHLSPETVGFAEMTMELCDGTPSFLESNLGYWLGTVRRYCPWHGKIVAEEVAPAGA